MRSFILLFCFCLPGLSVTAQLHSELSDNYDLYKEDLITNRRFKHRDVEKILEKHSSDLNVTQVGSSVGGKSINLVKFGAGSVSVLLWSQMHGNEPTATMALADIFNFLTSNDSDFEDVRQILSDQLTVYFIPMLNPDGADLFQRRNLYGFDINRDALRQQSPEGRVLKGVRDSLDADWGFNLHDQGRYTAAGLTSNPATLSFLAPAYNFEKDINDSRGDAIRLIGVMNDVIQQYIPGQVGKYPDDFEPRAFGDNIQKWGTRTILIESGGNRNDREKQEIRKYNFITLLTALHSIATNSFATQSYDSYEALPFNRSGRLHELILRNVELTGDGGESYLTDIAFRSSEIQDEEASKFYLSSYISDLGDLSTSAGYEEIDAVDYTAKGGKWYDDTLKDVEELTSIDVEELYHQGITDFVLDSISEDSRFTTDLSIHESKSDRNAKVELGNNPSLLLVNQKGATEYLVINGQLIKLE